MSPYVRFRMRHSGQPLSDFGENCATEEEAITKIENYEFLESFDVVINIFDRPKPGRNVLDAIKKRELALMKSDEGDEIGGQETTVFCREDIIANPKVFTALYEFPSNVSVQEQIQRMFDLTKRNEDEDIIDVPLSQLKYIPSKEWKHSKFANLSAELYVWQSAHGYPDYSGHRPLWINNNFEIEEGSSTFTSIKYNFRILEEEGTSPKIPCIFKKAVAPTGLTGISSANQNQQEQNGQEQVCLIDAKNQVEISAGPGILSELLAYVAEVSKILDFNVNIDEDVVYEYTSTDSLRSEDDPDKNSIVEKRYYQIKKLEINEGIFYLKYIETYNDGVFVSKNEILRKRLQSRRDISDSFAEILNSSYMISYYDSIIHYNEMERVEETEETFNQYYSIKKGFFYMGQYGNKNHSDIKKIYVRINDDDNCYEMITGDDEIR